MAARKPKAAPADEPQQQALAPAAVEPAANDEARASIATINTQLAEFDKVEAGITELETAYNKVAYPVATTDGMEQARAALKAIQTPRFAIEHARQAAKRPVIDIGRQIDTRAKQITQRLFAIETPIADQISAHETAEAARREAIGKRLKVLRELPQACIGKSVDELRNQLAEVDNIDLSTFQEFREGAAAAQLATSQQLGVLVTQAVEAEEARKRQEAEAAKERRALGFRERIAAISQHVVTAKTARSAASIQRVIDAVTAIQIDTTFEEFQAEAIGTKAMTLQQLADLHAEKVKAETPVATPAPTPAPALVATAAPTATPAPAAPAVAAPAAPQPVSHGGIGRYGGSLRGPREQFADVFSAPIVATTATVEHTRPSDSEILAVLVDHYDAPAPVVAGWLRTFDAAAALAQQTLIA